MMKMLGKYFFIAVGVSLLSACSTDPLGASRFNSVISESQERSLGAKQHNSITNKYLVYDAPALQRKINEVGFNIVRQSDRAHIEHNFVLLDASRANAFATLGGYIYISRGMIAHLNNEEELAALLAHLVGRSQRTQRGNSSRTRLINSMMMAGLLVNVQKDGGKQNQKKLFPSVMEVNALQCSSIISKDVFEADRLGVEYLARAGYQPESMIDVIGIFEDLQNYAMSHKGTQFTRQSLQCPRLDERRIKLQNVVSEFQSLNTSSQDSEEFKLLLDGLVFVQGDNEGVIDANYFYHKAYNFVMTYPQGWVLQNAGHGLMGADKNKETFITLTFQGNANDVSPEQFLQKNLNEDNYKFATLDKDTAIAKLNLSQPFLGNLILAKKYGGQMFVFNAYGKYVDEQLLHDVAHSMRPLSPEEIEQLQVRKIVLVRAKEGDTFESLAGKSNLANDIIPQLRLINGKYPDGQPKAGELIKILK